MLSERGATSACDPLAGGKAFIIGMVRDNEEILSAERECGVFSDKAEALVNDVIIYTLTVHTASLPPPR